MAFLIHHRIIDGEKKYRLWSTVVDEYVTDELSMDEIKDLTVKMAIRSAAEEALSELPRRLERAHKFGSSSAIDSGVPLDGPWKERPK